MTDTTTIADIRITPVAFADPPLLNSVGVHEPYALRSVVEVETSGGVVGLGESYGSSIHVSRLKMAAESLRGLDVQNLYALRQAVARALTDDRTSGGDGMAGMVTASSTLDRVYSPFEVAALDIQGQQYGVPVSTLLGGLARDEVSFTGYLFYKWAGHPGAEPDRWGKALDAAGILAQAETMVEEYGSLRSNSREGFLPPRRRRKPWKRSRTGSRGRRSGSIPTPCGRSRRPFGSADGSRASSNTSRTPHRVWTAWRT